MSRDPNQHLEALAKAQDTRLFRAQTLREVNAGTRMAADVLLSNDPRLTRMKLVKLIASIRRCGDATAKAIVAGYQLHENITLDRLSPVTRQRVRGELRELQQRRDAARRVA